MRLSDGALTNRDLSGPKNSERKFTVISFYINPPRQHLRKKRIPRERFLFSSDREFTWVVCVNFVYIRVVLFRDYKKSLRCTPRGRGVTNVARSNFSRVARLREKAMNRTARDVFNRARACRVVANEITRDVNASTAGSNTAVRRVDAAKGASLFADTISIRSKSTAVALSKRNKAYREVTLLCRACL